MFKFPVANMAEATDKNIRKLCSGVFSSFFFYMVANTTLNCLGFGMLSVGIANRYFIGCTLIVFVD